MKKTISIFIALVIIFNIVPFNAFAFETAKGTNEDLVALGCQVFPEYADRIISSQNASTFDVSTRQNLRIAFQETRNISENSQLTYIELTNGEVLFANSHYTVVPDLTYQESGTGGVNVYKYDFKITRLSSIGEFNLNNFTYRVYPSAYDTIISKGSLDYRACTPTQLYYDSQETASIPARLAYRIMFEFGNSGEHTFQCDFFIRIRNNNLSYEIVDYEA